MILLFLELTMRISLALFFNDVGDFILRNKRKMKEGGEVFIGKEDVWFYMGNSMFQREQTITQELETFY